MADIEKARVIGEYRGIYKLKDSQGEYLGKLTGKKIFSARSREDYPAVGDWVVITVQPAEAKASIHAILPRKSKFSRKIAGNVTDEQLVATNIDTVFLIQSLDKNYILRRLERYLVLALESGAEPVIILSKADLCETVEERLLEVEAIAPGVPVHALVCTQNGQCAETPSSFIFAFSNVWRISLALLKPSPDWSM